jgi:hypothetical protein
MSAQETVPMPALERLRDFYLRAAADALAHRESIDRYSQAPSDLMDRAASAAAHQAYARAADALETVIWPHRKLGA